jgi:hypothetical protein
MIPAGRAPQPIQRITQPAAEDPIGPKCRLTATTLAKLQAWLKTSGCEPSWGRADKARVGARFARSQMPRSSLLSNHSVVWTSTDGGDRESFSPMLESTRPGADLLLNLGPGLRALYGDPHAEALPDRLAALLERLSPEAMDAGAE